MPAPPDIPVGIPSELLERRPDVAAAERRMAAANAQIGVAISAYFPKLLLAAAGGWSSTQLSTWFSLPSRFWSVGPELAATLFDGGRRRATTEQARAAYDASVALYRQQALTAFQDVEDNLAALRILAQEARQQALAVEAAERALVLARNRYTAGITTYLEVITAQAVALNNERIAIDIASRRLTAAVNLVKALGGGWADSDLPYGTPPPPPTAKLRALFPRRPTARRSPADSFFPAGCRSEPGDQAEPVGDRRERDGDFRLVVVGPLVPVNDETADRDPDRGAGEDVAGEVSPVVDPVKRHHARRRVRERRPEPSGRAGRDDRSHRERESSVARRERVIVGYGFEKSLVIGGSGTLAAKDRLENDRNQPRKNAGLDRLAAHRREVPVVEGDSREQKTPRYGPGAFGAEPIGGVRYAVSEARSALLRLVGETTVEDHQGADSEDGAHKPLLVFGSPVQRRQEKRPRVVPVDLRLVPESAGDAGRIR